MADAQANEHRYCLFRLGERRLALPLDCVRHAQRAAALLPLAGAPALVAGLLSLHGEVVPVIDLRPRLGLPVRALALADQLLLLQLPQRRLALWVDEVLEVRRIEPAERQSIDRLQAPAQPCSPLFAGVVEDAEGLLLIQQPTAFLSEAEADALQQALARVEAADA